MAFIITVFLVTIASKVCTAESATSDDVTEMMVTMERLLHDIQQLKTDNQQLKTDNQQVMTDNQYLKSNVQQLTSKMALVEERLERRFSK